MPASQLTKIPGIGPAAARILAENGFSTVAAVARATDKDLAQVPGFGAVRAAEVINRALSLLAAGDALEAGATPETDKKSKDKKKKGKKGKKKGKKRKKKKKKKDGKKKRKIKK